MGQKDKKVPGSLPGSRRMHDIAPALARLRAEHRRFKPVRVDLPGRLFVPTEGQEARCTILNLSAGGAEIECEIAPASGTQVVLYVDGFGRFEGGVAPIEGPGFSVEFHCTPLKRERIAEQLTMFLNKSLVDGVALRRHDRAPTKGFTRYTRADGQLVRCEVLDLSTGGVSLKTDVRPPVGEYVLIGQMAGRVARHHEMGIGIEFVGNIADRSSTDRIQTKIGIAR